MTETLLTVLAVSQENYNGPMSHAIPARLASTFRTARKNGLVYVDDAGMYLEEEGAAALEAEMGSRPFA